MCLEGNSNKQFQVACNSEGMKPSIAVKPYPNVVNKWDTVRLEQDASRKHA